MAVAATLVFLALAFAYLRQADLPNIFLPTYDGWTVGAPEGCPEPNFDPASGRPSAWDCEATLELWLSAAREGFDRRDPTHATVVRATLHQYAGNGRFLSNCCLVAVFEMKGGTVRAIGVTHLGVDYSRVASVDYGPDR